MFVRTFLALSFSLAASCALADRIHVDVNTQFNGSGVSWGTAMASLSDALAIAQPGDEIWIADGAYSPDPADGRDGTFLIPGGVAVYGGFLGGENFLDERPVDFSAAQTILSGLASNNYSVVTLGGGGTFAFPTTILDRLIIEDGNADGSGAGPRTRGGGIYAELVIFCELSDVLIRDCHADDAGGGLYAMNPVSDTFFDLNGVRFSRCTTYGEGGGAYMEASTTILTDCEFSRCEADTGGGMHVAGDGDISIADSRFLDNTALLGGGAGARIQLTDGTASSTIERSTFTDNTAQGGGDGGGILYAGRGSHTLRESRLLSNRATTGWASGGAIAVETDGPSALINLESCLISGNEAQFVGGAIHAVPTQYAITRVANCTVGGNTSVTGSVGAIHYDVAGEMIIRNSILWDNEAFTTDRQSKSVGGSGSLALTVTYSIVEHLGVVQPPPTGSNNSGADPMLADADGPDDTYGTEDDDPALAPGSPAIDAGDTTQDLSETGLDVNGNPRRSDDPDTPDTGVSDGADPVIDIGAAEVQGPDCVADTNGDGMLSPADFNGWIIAFNTQSPACDQNGDGLCTPADFNGWIINFNNGCP